MRDDNKINIVLAGQGNSGKSTIFNYLTGLHQHIGNWAGKTIEKAEGTLFYRDHMVDVLDLPGIYSLTTVSEEELISRSYIIKQNPDCVINVVDSTNLERSLIFTLQLLELERPVIIALNMTDLAKRKGITVDVKKLQKILNVPVIPTIASRGSGLTRLVDKAIDLKTGKPERTIHKYGKEIEQGIEELSDQLKGIDLPYPLRWIAIKLLEKDSDITARVSELKPRAVESSLRIMEELEEIHGHDSPLVIADERSLLASRITRETVKIAKDRELSLNERLEALTTHKVTGYLFMILILGGMFLAVFSFGNRLSEWLDSIFSGWHDLWEAGVAAPSGRLWAGRPSKVSSLLSR